MQLLLAFSSVRSDDYGCRAGGRYALPQSQSSPRRISGGDYSGLIRHPRLGGHQRTATCRTSRCEPCPLILNRVSANGIFLRMQPVTDPRLVEVKLIRDVDIGH